MGKKKHELFITIDLVNYQYIFVYLFTFMIVISRNMELRTRQEKIKYPQLLYCCIRNSIRPDSVKQEKEKSISLDDLQNTLQTRHSNGGQVNIRKCYLPANNFHSGRSFLRIFFFLLLYSLYYLYSFFPHAVVENK